MTAEPSHPSRDESLTAFIEQARWFGGKGRSFEVVGVRELPLTENVVIALVSLAYADGGTDLYQVPLSSYAQPEERLAHASVGHWDDRYHYDALHDREATAAWLHGFDSQTAEKELVFHRIPGYELDLDQHSTLFSGEQSNSSVAFGEDSLMKVFRRVTPGNNPDIEIHESLTRAGSDHVAHLFGWLEAPATGSGTGEEGVLQLAMLQQFLRTATDGWELALNSVRNLFGEADLHPDEVGGDFAGEAYRLGVAVAEVHEVLRTHFPTSALDPLTTVAGMHERLQRAAEEHPDLEPFVPMARGVFDAMTALGGNPQSQRIHGDLHLGQTLRTVKGWKIVDFEGEPAKPLAERMLPDSPWRDVAGMLRSLDYAARTVERDLQVDDEAAAQLAYRGEEWVRRNREAFLDGYAEAAGGLTDDESALIAAYEVDKAIYEVGYEGRNRPSWIGIPLAALQRLAGETR